MTDRQEDARVRRQSTNRQTNARSGHHSSNRQMDARSRRMRARRRRVRRQRMIMAALVLLVLLIFIIIAVAVHKKGRRQAVTATDDALMRTVQIAANEGIETMRGIIAQKKADEPEFANLHRAVFAPRDAAIVLAQKIELAKPPTWFWASPEGATGGTADDALPDDDPSKLESTGRVIYLTFDDGPGPETERLLGILEKYDVLATFFVTGQDPEYFDMIAREAEAGHSIGVHTYWHDYYEIYESTDAFWADFEKTQDLIVEQTGRRSELARFPGGSSNTVSNITPGIMTTLTQQMEDKGYTYFDWNVTSGDGESSSDRDIVYDNITTYVPETDVSVVLCHDLRGSTIDAMEDVIQWGLENGYTFLPLSPHSFPAHHGVNN